MTKSEKNGTAPSTSFLTKDTIKEAIQLERDERMNLKTNKNHFGKSIFESYSTVAQKLFEEYDNLDKDYVLNVTKLLSTFTDKETSDANFSACRSALDNLIHSKEILLIETMFENDLESLSKDGIKIFEIDGGLDIRNGGKEKYLPPEDRKKLEQHLVGSYENSSDGFLDGSTDFSGQTVSFKPKQGVKGDVNFNATEVTLEIENDEEVIGYLNDKHK